MDAAAGELQGPLAPWAVAVVATGDDMGEPLQELPQPPPPALTVDCDPTTGDEPAADSG